jgi:hypothetical protein
VSSAGRLLSVVVMVLVCNPARRGELASQLPVGTFSLTAIIYIKGIAAGGWR